jgi:hypothetical protein
MVTTRTWDGIQTELSPNMSCNLSNETMLVRILQRIFETLTLALDGAERNAHRSPADSRLLMKLRKIFGVRELCRSYLKHETFLT